LLVNKLNKQSYNSDFFFLVPSLFQPLRSLVDSLAKYLIKSSTSRAPSYLRGDNFEFLGTKNIVGKPLTSYKLDGISLAVASILAITISFSLLNFLANSSYLGAKFLQ
jgi:hypothetical protein